LDLEHLASVIPRSERANCLISGETFRCGDSSDLCQMLSPKRVGRLQAAAPRERDSAPECREEISGECDARRRDLVRRACSMTTGACRLKARVRFDRERSRSAARCPEPCPGVDRACPVDHSPSETQPGGSRRRSSRSPVPSTLLSASGVLRVLCNNVFSGNFEASRRVEAS
jgi:hypothetical protein